MCLTVCVCQDVSGNPAESVWERLWSHRGHRDVSDHRTLSGGQVPAESHRSHSTHPGGGEKLTWRRTQLPHCVTANVESDQHRAFIIKSIVVKLTIKQMNCVYEELCCGCVSVHGELWQSPDAACHHLQSWRTVLLSDRRAVHPQGETERLTCCLSSSRRRQRGSSRTNNTTLSLSDAS